MFTLLENLSKKLKEEFEIDCFVMPIAVRNNQPQLVFFSKSLMSYEEGPDKYGRGKDYLRIEEELHISAVLKARGKTRAFMEDFYSINKKLTRKFRRPFNLELGENLTFNVIVNLQKIQNGGEYWTNEEGDQHDDLYNLSELWEGVIKYKDN